MKIENIHNKLLILLKDIDRICTEYHINYSLFGGTIIGAVRHQGFIPWDDDADVVFERKEYERFIQILPDEFEINRAPWTPRFRKKGTDIFIDIFVFDFTSNNVYRQKQQVLKLKFLQGTLKDKITLSKGGITGIGLSLITYVIGLFFSKKYKLRMYDVIAQEYNLKESDYVFSSLDQYKYIGNILPKAIFGSYEKVPFEETKLMIMSNYYEYLTKFYGDYMKLPDEDKQIPEHGRAK